MNKFIIINTLCDKKETAEKIQNTLLEKRLIAGCQISEKNRNIGGIIKLKKQYNKMLKASI